MEYQGPTPDDLVNVTALNRRFIRCNPGALRDAAGNNPPRRLSDLQLSRLAETPFLLFSFREQDGDFWQRLLRETPQLDLIDHGDPPDAQTVQLQMAGLAFMWHLTSRNPYAARLVSGAPVSWCENIASMPLVRLLQRAALRGDLLRVCLPQRDRRWRRLMANGASAQAELRLASHHSALQAMLMRDRERPAGRIAAAACAMPTSTRRKSRSDTRGFGSTKV